MLTAQSTLIFDTQDGKMLSCRRWFISVMVFNFNILILGIFALGLSGCFEPNKTLALEVPSKIQAVERADIQNELINWLEAKSVKYANYRLSYPAEGIIHAKGAVPAGKGSVRVNVLEINKKLNPNLEIKPQTASDYLNSRVKIRKIADKTNAIAAVNGGYFKPQTGVPLGALVIDNELLTGPVYNRAAFSINNDGTYSVGKTDMKFSLKNKKIDFKIDNVNQPRMLSTYTLLYTEKWGKTSPPPPKYGVNAVIKNGFVAGIYKTSVEIPASGYVVSGPENVVKQLSGQKKLTFEIKYPSHFEKAGHIISGGPFLVKNGEIYIDAKEEKLTSITGKNPRTLIGHTENNELILVTVDGRESHSVGMSLYEAAKYMQKLGCINAINLDGGSSSVMYLKGRITNTPPVEGGIPISGALVVGLNSAISSSESAQNKM